MIQQPRAPCGQADADVCQHCAGDCPASGHEKTCRGGCSPCTCGGHDPLDVDAFKAWAATIGYSPSTTDNAASHIRRLVETGTTTDDAIDVWFANHRSGSRRRQRVYLHMYQDFMKQTGRSA